MNTIEVRIPRFPECWQSCGSCGQGEVVVDEVLVSVGDTIERDETIIVLETGKVALDIPAPRAGRIAELFVQAGDQVTEGDLILQLMLD